MLNNVISLDLHIHSYASFYKEPKYKNGESYVEHSTKENVEVLLNNLLEKEITLFSITDHNRYDIELYRILINKLKSNKYQTLKLLHGIEFDVQLELDKKTAHIITIFNVNDETDMRIINDVINDNLLEGKKDYYTKELFEKLRSF